MPFKNPFSKKGTPLEAPKEWRAWQLSTSFTTSLFVIEIGLVVLIIVLERVSTKNNGLTTVSELPTDPVRNEPFSNIIWSYGLLWTALPALLMAVYRIGWEAIVSATAERQPYIDLNRPEENAHTAGRTIMLDYRTYPILYNWLVAFKMRHVTIGFAMILSSVLSIVLVPLTSHLFLAMPTIIVTTFNATSPNTFNSAQLMNLDLQPALSLARSTLAYNAESPPWSTTKFSFEPFDFAQTDDPRNHTVPVNAYYGQLDCELMPAPQPLISRGSPLNTLTYEIVDRGCKLPELQIPLGDLYPTTVVRTWGTTSCGFEAHDSRLAMLSGNPTSSTSITNLSIISCIPSYWKTTGALTISTRKDLPPRVESFVEHTDDESEFRPFGANLLEIDLTLYQQSDPKGIFYRDLLGIVIYEVAQKASPDNPLDPTALQKALGSVWPAVFTYLTTTFLIQEPKPRTVIGQDIRSENRLFVYPPVAWIVVAIMISVAICNAFLIFNAEKDHSILQEEPVGLLGAAALLHDSQVTNFVAENRGRVPLGLTFREAIQKKYTVSGSKCWWDRETKIIQLTGLDWQQTDTAAEEGTSRSGSSGIHPAAAPSASQTEPPATQTATGIELQPLSSQSTVDNQPMAVPDTSGPMLNQISPRASVSALSERGPPTVQENRQSAPEEHLAETEPAALNAGSQRANIESQQRVSRTTW